MLLRYAAVASAVVLFMPSIAFGQKDDPTLRDYLRKNQMIHVPLPAQTRVSPGSLIVIQGKDHWYSSKNVPDYRFAEKGLPDPKIGTVTQGTEVVNHSLKVNGGSSIYGVAIGGLFNHSKDLDYKSTDIPVSELPIDPDNLLKDDETNPTRQAVLKYTFKATDKDGSVHPQFDTYTVYIVESVYNASDLDIYSSSSTALSLNNGPATTECKDAEPRPPEDNASGARNSKSKQDGAQGAGPAKPPADGQQDSANGNAGTDKPEDKNKGDGSDKGDSSGKVSFGLCKVGNGHYQLRHTPPVAFGVRVKEVYWDFNDKQIETRQVPENLSFDK